MDALLSTYLGATDRFFIRFINKDGHFAARGIYRDTADSVANLDVIHGGWPRQKAVAD
jgi:hypothetical protein